MIIINGIALDDGVDEPNDDWDDHDGESPLGPAGCLFPGQCCMPGSHYHSECHTAEDLMSQEEMTTSALSPPPSAFP